MHVKDRSIVIRRETPVIIEQVVGAVRGDSRLHSYHVRNQAELLGMFRDVCRNLEHWLDARDESLLRRRYSALAQERIQQQVPLTEVVLAAQNFEQTVIEHLRRKQDLEDHVSIDRNFEDTVREFFDQMVYSLVETWERVLLQVLS